MRIGYFAHWFRPHWSFNDFIADAGYEIEKIDYTQKNYLEKYDVAIIEQNGFNDYIENDELYIRDWVSRGGIVLFMHQDYERWAPYFLPHELGYTQLIHRYVRTVPSLNKNKNAYFHYMMPWFEGKGRELLNYPETVTPDEMLGWEVRANSFRLIMPPDGSDTTETILSAAQSCFLANPNWEILGSYMDPAVKDGALVLQGRYGKGMYFLNQIMVPEELNEKSEKCLNFWKKYLKNLMAYFENFKNGVTPEIPPVGEIPSDKRNYKVAVHMHSLDWHGCDSAPGTINAIMRYMNYDICSFAIKDAAPYEGGLAPEKFSDGKVLFLDGQEYHPFNWNDRFGHISHNGYHMLAVGIDHDSYTPEFTRSLFSDAEIDAYLKKALAYIKEKNGASIATHPNQNSYWHDYPYDAVDTEPLHSLAGTNIEEYYLKGRKIAMMVSVDLFGFQRILDNPAPNFIYLEGEKPSRDSVVKAIKKGHTIAACGFSEADITFNGALPGDEISCKNGTLHISARPDDGKVSEIRVYADDKVIYRENPDAEYVNKDIAILENDAKYFIRVEVTGKDDFKVLTATPFYIKA